MMPHKKQHMISLLLIVLILSVLISSCDPYTSYSEEGQYGNSPYDGILSWTRDLDPAAYSSRYHHASAVFDGKLWVVGGRGYQGLFSDNYLEDVWCSEDGLIWEQVLEDAPWHGRAGHALAVANGKMYLIGGYAVDQTAENTNDTNHYMNDVWETEDGITWTEVTPSAPFGDRAYHGVAVIEGSGEDSDTIYVIAGRNRGIDYHQDIWKSTDGQNWTEVLDSPTLGRRGAMGVTVSGTNIYILGGYAQDYEATFDSTAKRDWKGLVTFDTTDTDSLSRAGSPPNRDGINYDSRAHLELVSYEGTCFILPGASITREYENSHPNYYSTYYFTDPGTSITADSAGSGFGPRYGYTAEVFDEKLWILGGYSLSGPEHDIWYAEMGGGE
jgi:hypothetical protein